MAGKNHLVSNRRDVLKAGVAGVGAAAFAPGLGGALAATDGVRSDLTTPAGRKMLDLYEQAVALMKKKEINDPPQPHSWTFQAYIHCLPRHPLIPEAKDNYLGNGSPAFLAKVDEIYGKNPTGPAADWKKAALACWSTCPHESPYFLPWHRWYLHYFEEIIRGVLNNKDFYLPYWNYAINAGSSLQVPEKFKNPKSSLYEVIRGKGFKTPLGSGKQDVPMNGAGYMLYKNINYRPALTADVYFVSDSGEPDLYFPPSPEWYDYGVTGRIETQPHDNVHVGVGGLMGTVPTAARDPVFFVHHCQVDHLWASWQAYPGSTINFAAPGQGTVTQLTEAEWTAKQFQFVDRQGTLVTVSPPGAVNYQESLGYGYDSLAPRPSALVASALVASRAKAAPVEKTAAPVTLAAKADVSVSATGTTLALASTAPVAANVEEAVAGRLPTHLVLRGVELQQLPDTPLYVFINAPAAALPGVDGPYYVGHINTFNLTMDSPDDGGTGHHHHPGGHNFVFPITAVLAAQEEDGLWDGGDVTVTVTTESTATAGKQVLLTIAAIELVS